MARGGDSATVTRQGTGQPAPGGSAEQTPLTWSGRMVMDADLKSGSICET